MLACTETITLVRCDSKSYTQWTIEGVSWYDRHPAQMDATGMVYGADIRIRIPADRVTEMPRPGDIVILGEAGAISGPADIDKYNHARVMTVGDNRRGRLPHVVVMAS